MSQERTSTDTRTIRPVKGFARLSPPAVAASRDIATAFFDPSPSPWRDVGHHRTPNAPLLADPAFVAARQLLADEDPCDGQEVFRPRAPRRADRSARLATVLDALLAAIERSPDAPQYHAAFAALHYTGSAPVMAGVDSHVLRVLLTLSDLLLQAAEPCRRDAKRRRQRGIVRRGDTYPYIEPPRDDPRAELCRLIDERSFLVVPQMHYVIRDWAGDPHKVLGPTGDRGYGRLSRDPFRAAFSFSLAALYKRCELLREEDRHGRYAGWPYPTRIAGLIAAGSKEDITVDVTEYLRFFLYGPPPSSDDDSDLTPPAATPPPPPLLHQPLIAAAENGDDEFEITELPQLPLARACEVAR
jgi:hypothetical protein